MRRANRWTDRLVLPNRWIVPVLVLLTGVGWGSIVMAYVVLLSGW